MSGLPYLFFLAFAFYSPHNVYCRRRKNGRPKTGWKRSIFRSFSNHLFYTLPTPIEKGHFHLGELAGRRRMSGLARFLKAKRVALSFDGKAVRTVSHSLVLSKADELLLAQYIASKAPLFYRNLSNIITDMSESGHFGAVIKDTLSRIPKSQSFRESHFCEIVSGLFAEEVLGLVRIYSKLTLLTAENANAYKMDLVLCRPESTPVEFVFGEVKSSTKSTIPANHHKSCFADLFTSFNEYGSADLQFDLTAARDRVESLPTQYRQKIFDALLPYSSRIIKYAGFVVIDSSTFKKDEVSVLACRKNQKNFDVDLLSVETLKDVSTVAYSVLQKQLEAF